MQVETEKFCTQQLADLMRDEKGARAQAQVVTAELAKVTAERTELLSSLKYRSADLDKHARRVIELEAQLSSLRDHREQTENEHLRTLAELVDKY
jgi:hypothetical protein